MVLELIKNPIVIGIIIATISYIYLGWKQSKKEKRKNKDINILIPVSIGCISSLVFYFIFNNTSQQIVQQTPSDFIAPGIVPNKLNISDENQSYHLIGRNITVPHNIPDLIGL